VLGGVAGEYEFDWATAEKHFLRAIELNPNYATAHQWYSEFLSATGRFNEAIDEIRIAEELDPLSPIIKAVAGLTLVRFGETEAGFAEFDEIAEMDPSFPPLYYTRQYAHFCTGEFGKAAKDFIRYNELTAATAGQREDAKALALALETGGVDAYYRELLAQEKNAYMEASGSPVNIAASFARMGEADSAVVWLERAIDQRANQTFSIARNCSFAPIANSPRFIELLNRMNIEYRPLQ